MTEDVVLECIIKIGGAAITNKNQFETLLPENLKSIAKTLGHLFK